MTGDEKAFLSINRSITSNVRMGNGALVDAKGRGTISINRKGSGKQIHDVFYVPDSEEICLVLVNSWKMVILLCLEIIVVEFMIKLSQIKSLLK